MMLKRREVLAGLVGSCLVSSTVWAGRRPTQKVTLLHTNDTHSRIEPFAQGRFKGMGGVARRATLLSTLRRQNPATLVVDAGDIFQGTPYFNMFRGEVELKAMSQMGYDIATLGNHDFDLGAEWLLKMITKHATFPFVTANLLFSQKEAHKQIRPYTIRSFGGWRLGIFGLGVRFRGLTAANLHQGVTYVDPVAVATKMVKHLREDKRCDAVILLSHLGYTGFDGEVGDIDLAKRVQGLDVIIGGHTHTFLKKPTIVQHGKEKTYILQVGHSGIYLGQIDLLFEIGQQVKVQNHAHPIK